MFFRCTRALATSPPVAPLRRTKSLAERDLQAVPLMPNDWRQSTKPNITRRRMVLLKRLQQHALMDRTSVTMETLLATGKGQLLGRSASRYQPLEDEQRVLTEQEMTVLQVGSFLRRELPVRFAHRAQDLDNMPDGLYKMEHIQMVKQWYMDSFEDLTSVRAPRTIEESRAFTEVLKGIKTRHDNTNIAIAQGLTQFQSEVLSAKTFVKHLSELHGLHEALDNFFISRIGIRVLMGRAFPQPAPSCCCTPRCCCASCFRCFCVCRFA